MTRGLHCGDLLSLAISYHFLDLLTHFSDLVLLTHFLDLLTHFLDLAVTLCLCGCDYRYDDYHGHHCVLMLTIDYHYVLVYQPAPWRTNNEQCPPREGVGILTGRLCPVSHSD